MTYPLINTLKTLDLLDRSRTVDDDPRQRLVNHVFQVCVNEGQARSLVEVEQAVDQVLVAPGTTKTQESPVTLLTEVPRTRKEMVALVEAPFKPPANEAVQRGVVDEMEALWNTQESWAMASIMGAALLGLASLILMGSGKAMASQHLIPGAVGWALGAAGGGLGWLCFGLCRRIERGAIFVGRTARGQERACLYWLATMDEKTLKILANHPDLARRLLAIKQAGRPLVNGDWEPLADEARRREGLKVAAATRESEGKMLDQLAQHTQWAGPV